MKPHWTCFIICYISVSLSCKFMGKLMKNKTSSHSESHDKHNSGIKVWKCECDSKYHQRDYQVYEFARTFSVHCASGLIWIFINYTTPHAKFENNSSCCGLFTP